MNKTAIILTPYDRNELDIILNKLLPFRETFDCEVIVVFENDFDDMPALIDFLEAKKCRWGIVHNDASKTVKRNIGRYLASDNAKYLLFLDSFVELNQKWLTERVRGFSVEPVLGIIGKLAKPVDRTIQEALLKKLKTFIHILNEHFTERCCLKDGTFRYVEEGSIATTTKVFDLIGGFSVTSEFPNLEYNARVQALGYGILPQPE
jgi:hypothetical protein